MIDHLHLLLRRHFKRLRKLAPAGKVCEPADRSAFWSGHITGASACSTGAGPHQAQAEASAWTDRHGGGGGGKHDRHHHGKRGRKSDHGHGRIGRWGWLAEASAAAGGHRVMTDVFYRMQLVCLTPSDQSTSCPKNSLAS